jgi:hypothetical protein
MSAVPSMTMLLLFSLVAVTAGLANNAAHNHKGSHFVRGLAFKHRLRVCNAYPDGAALDVMRAQEKLTKEPLEYKACGDFSTPLIAGDKLKFVVGGASAGTFVVSDLPNNDAILLLVIQRHDTLSTSVSFQSHVFANLLNAQVAVIDTFKGKARGFAELTDGSKREEKLRYNSVVAVNPGKYRVSLLDSKKKVEIMKDFVALNRESYVIIRSGVESEQSPQYSQELIVFPQSDPALLHNSAPCQSVPIGALMVAMVVAALRQ